MIVEFAKLFFSHSLINANETNPNGNIPLTIVSGSVNIENNNLNKICKYR